FPVTYADERFVVPFILTPVQLQIHLSPTSAVTGIDSLTGCAIETCPPGWMRGLTGFCWHREESEVAWSEADQFCTSGLAWGGWRGRLLLGKTVVERNILMNG
uniref:C-type lectin domain-containing protein n=2 Tax=Macrostomum lignano TaxID=282301 RepID=A0A1I8J5Y0_9PLAT